MFDDEIREKAQELIQMAMRRQVLLCTAESCTGGMLATLLTSISGSSNVFDRGFVTYSNIAKFEMLGVPLDLINQNGAVSSQVAAAMATGALKNSRAQIAVSITGIAGPNGGSDEKPVGLVHFSLAKSGHLSRQFEFKYGNIGREAIRIEACRTALSLFERAL